MQRPLFSYSRNSILRRLGRLQHFQPSVAHSARRWPSKLHIPKRHFSASNMQDTASERDPPTRKHLSPENLPVGLELALSALDAVLCLWEGCKVQRQNLTCATPGGSVVAQDFRQHASRDVDTVHSYSSTTAWTITTLPSSSVDILAGQNAFLNEDKARVITPTLNEDEANYGTHKTMYAASPTESGKRSYNSKGKVVRIDVM